MTKFLSATCIICLLSLPAYAQDEVHPFISDKFSVQVGVFLPSKKFELSVDGTAAGISREINLEYTPLIIAAYILFTVWGPKVEFSKPLKGEFVAIGLVQTGLSMLVGATGPMGQAALLGKGLQRDALVVTSALMTTFTHLIKTVLFGLLGFSFISYWEIIVGMSAGVIGGALLGTHIRYKIPQALFLKILKWVLTLLALRMIYITLA